MKWHQQLRQIREKIAQNMAALSDESTSEDIAELKHFESALLLVD